MFEEGGDCFFADWKPRGGLYGWGPGTLTLKTTVSFIHHAARIERKSHFLGGACSFGASSVVSISLSEPLSDSEPEELSDPDELSSLELSSFGAFSAAFTLCFWWLPGSGEVDDRLELLSLPDEDEAAMATVYKTRLAGNGDLFAVIQKNHKVE